MGTVFRIPMGQENVELGERSLEAVPCLAKARWLVFALSAIPRL